MQIYEVGGCVRDSLLGVQSKDIDFVVVTPGGYAAMRHYIVSEGLRIYQEREEFVTIRAGVPDGHPLRRLTKDADFVLARRDSATGDGRRPDYVEAGTLADDLARRDFTVNAMARCTTTGELIDLHGGREDLDRRELRFVGDAGQRIREDGLRVMRAFRFAITKGFAFAPESWGVDDLGGARYMPGTWDCLVTAEAATMLHKVAVERIGDELEKMLQADTIASLGLFSRLPDRITRAIFRDGMKLEPTLKGRKPKAKA